MAKFKTRWTILGLACLLVLPAQPLAQSFGAICGWPGENFAQFSDAEWIAALKAAKRADDGGACLNVTRGFLALIITTDSRGDEEEAERRFADILSRAGLRP